MTTWTLLLIFAVGSNSAASISISDIKSFAECNRVYQTIMSGPIGQAYGYGRTVSQCVEVIK